VLDEVPGLDAEAIDGLHEWIDFVKQMPSTAREIFQ
jgi:hypothetical protein